MIRNIQVRNYIVHLCLVSLGKVSCLLRGKVTKSSTGTMIQLWRFLFGLVLSPGGSVFLILQWINVLFPIPPTHMEDGTNWCWHVSLFMTVGLTLCINFLKCIFTSDTCSLVVYVYFVSYLETVHWPSLCLWSHVGYHLKWRTELSRCTYWPYVLRSSKN